VGKLNLYLMVQRASRISVTVCDLSECSKLKFGWQSP